MNKKLIRLTESDLHRIVKESVHKVIKESLQGNNTFMIVGNNIRIRIEVGHTIEEWKSLLASSQNGQSFEWENDYWDLSIEDLLTGAVEPDEDMTYWLIDGRLYETPY